MRKKAGKFFPVRRHCCNGRLFQVAGPTTEKAECCMMEMLASRSPWAAERKGGNTGRDRTGQQSSGKQAGRQAGTVLRRQHQTKADILKVIC